MLFLKEAKLLAAKILLVAIVCDLADTQWHVGCEEELGGWMTNSLAILPKGRNVCLVMFSYACFLLEFQDLFRFAVFHRIRFVCCETKLYLFPWTCNIELTPELSFSGAAVVI